MRKWLPVRGGALVPWDTLKQGVGWVYDRAVDGVPGLDGAEELAAHYRERHPGLDEAIAMHDGEARNTRRRWEQLPASDRAALISFLQSL